MYVGKNLLKTPEAYPINFLSAQTKTKNQIIMSNETKTPRCRGGSRTRLKSHRGHPSSQSFRYTADHPKTLRQVAVAAKP